MARIKRSCWTVLPVLVLGSTLVSPSNAHGSSREPEPAIIAPAESMTAIKSALELLPQRPAQVGVVDTEGAKPEVRERLLKADAFVTPGGRTVYLVRESEVLKRAQTGSSVFVCMLAAIMWHEMAHIDGADEAEAQRREEGLWKRFLLDNRVDRVTALRYLKAMNERRH
jgi:hypothetical protein